MYEDFDEIGIESFEIVDTDLSMGNYNPMLFS